MFPIEILGNKIMKLQKSLAFANASHKTTFKRTLSLFSADEIVGVQSEATQVRELCREERRRSSAQRFAK